MCIKLSTTNVKNVISNDLYMNHLLKEHDIVCIQEHWLFQFQLNKLDALHKNFNSLAKAVDRNDPISPVQIPRGYGGNAILYRTDWDLKTSPSEEGSERITVILLESSPAVCIISVYLPCRGNKTKDDYIDTLHELDELIKKYSPSHAIFICGDFNASLSRSPPNDRDKLLRDFVTRHQLICQQEGEPTFTHPNGESKAEIDYILKNELAVKISGRVFVDDSHPDNVSDHETLYTDLNISFRVNNSKPTLTCPKPNWTKCNKLAYRECIQSNIHQLNQHGNDLDAVQALKSILDKATAYSIPGYKPNIKKPRKYITKQKGHDIHQAAKRSKVAWWRWKEDGKPRNPNSLSKNAMIQAKRLLRKAQRVAAAKAKREEFNKIMESQSNNKNMFYKLIRTQRNSNKPETGCLLIEDRKLSSPDEVRKGWASHFESLGQPKSRPTYNDAHLENTKGDLQALEKRIINNDSGEISPATVEETAKAVSKLNNNKAADHLGLTAEHFKNGGKALLEAVTTIINNMFAHKKVPPPLKKGTITPIHKKGDLQNPDNYRGITVTPVLLKIVEHILNQRHASQLHATQSTLQTGFTKGTSSAMSALLVSECVSEAKTMNKELLLVTLDTRKAFDVVNHDILLSNLIVDGIPFPEWVLIKDIYEDMKSTVMWQGEESKIFCINQGVRQGGVLSTEHYKRYNNPLLLKLESHYSGAKIGNIKIPHTTCADDLALLSHSSWETQSMLHTVEEFSRDNRYDINAAKSSCIIHNKRPRATEKNLRLEGDAIPMDNTTTHLGIQRNTKAKLAVEEKINLGRKTAYSLLGAGLHGKSGLKQDVKAHIWTTFISPRMLYGVETVNYTDSDLKKLDDFQRKLIKQVQHLPNRVANAAAESLMGTIPPSALVHKNTLNLYHRIISGANPLLLDIADRQLAVKTQQDNSFFSRVRRLLQKYNLPSAYSLRTDTPDKETWKKLLNEAVDGAIQAQWQEDIQEKLTLRYLNPSSVKVGSAHHVYTTVRANVHDTRRAETKAQNEAVELYKQFAKFPQTSQVSFSKGRCGNGHVVNTVQTQRDLERATNITFAKSYYVNVQENESCEVFYTSTPQELSNELWSKESPSGKYRAVVRKVADKKQEDKFYIEIWDGNHKIHNVDVLSLEKHGKVYDADGYFGSFAWSLAEDKLLYVAEKKYPKAVSFFAKAKEEENQESKTVQGDEYVYREEWGEGLVGKHFPVLCVLTVATEEVSLLDSIPQDVSPGQAVWSPTDDGIVFTGWYHEPFRLGLIYCPIRKSQIFHVNLQTGQCDALTCEDESSRCPRFSPDNNQLMYLQCKAGGPHMQCCELLLYDWAKKTTKTVIKEVSQAQVGEFPGLYIVVMQSNCWASDSERVVCSSVWRSRTVALVINTSTGKVTRLPTDRDCGMTVLGIKDDLIVAQCSSPCRPFYLVVGRLPPTGQEGTIQWTCMDTSLTDIDDISWKIIQHQPSPDRLNSKYPTLDYESVLVHNTGKNKTKKLVIFPHGGPHSAFPSDFMMYPSLLCKLGFSSLLVNYRGSIGFGSNTIDSLLGRVGDQDVKDVMCAALEVIEKEGYSKDKVVVWGGSHGGFLTCHLIGQYPGFFKAAVCRNPVINIATMIGSSDIPDWCSVEAGVDYKYDLLPEPALLEKMWKCSPLQYVDNINTPVMLMIGQDDKRCPTKQSYELYKALKARHKPVRFISYPDNGHPIVKVDSEADAFINIYKWFMEYVPDSKQ